MDRREDRVKDVEVSRSRRGLGMQRGGIQRVGNGMSQRGVGEGGGRGVCEGEGGRGSWNRSSRSRGERGSLEDMFDEIRKEMEGKLEAVVGDVGDKIQGARREGMKVIVETVKEKMSMFLDKVKGVEAKVSRMSDRIEQEKRERMQTDKRKDKKTARMEERVKKGELGVKAVEGMVGGIAASVAQEASERNSREQRIWEELARMEDRVKEVEAKVGKNGQEGVGNLEVKIQTLQAEVDRLSGLEGECVLEENIKEMEGKVREAMRAVKVVNINIGQDTEDKATIVRKALAEVRRYARKEDAGQLDWILRRTRVVVLGRRTREVQRGNSTVHTVPIMFQCEERKDTQELDRILRGAGYFPTFHWPDKAMTFVRKVLEDVRSADKQERFYKVRPEVWNGRVRIRVDTKLKAGGRYVMKGIWKCPPLKQELWGKVGGLHTPQVVGKC